MHVWWAPQYFCVGMSLWDQERLQAANKKAVKPGDLVELPYCEGLEIISAAQLQQAPVILSNEAGALPQAAEPSSPEPQRPPGRCCFLHAPSNCRVPGRRSEHFHAFPPSSCPKHVIWERKAV